MTPMKSQSLLVFLLPVLAVVVLGTGCAEDPVGTGDGPESGLTLDEMNLDLAYGGLAYTDEPEAFGDAGLLDEAMVEDAAATLEAEDEAAAVQDVPRLQDAPVTDLVRTYVRVAWGNLDGERTSTDAAPPETSDFLTWDGALQVSEGNALVLRKTILFERPFDHLLPRENRQTLAWHSTTLPHVDGVLVCILSRPAEDGSLSGELTFRTPLLSRTFTLDELVDLEATVRVDDLGNGVSFLGFRAPDTDLCPRGFLGGRWHSAPEGNGGLFAGRLVTAQGRLLGYLKGRYGVTGAGERVFAGKIIGRGGHILGLMQGTWEPSSEADGAGVFAGRWVGRARQHVGSLRGRYQSLPDRPGGTFGGRWDEACRDEA
jgi:hypothetical protein